jgi:DNA replication protein DnaC
MLYEQTVQKLLAMKLGGMVEALEDLRSRPDMVDLSFEDRLALLVEKQWLLKENRALATRIKYARLKQQAAPEDIDFRHPRGLTRAQVDQLSSPEWIRCHQNCVITGPTGTGKTYLSCAIAQRACRNGFRALYSYAPKLFRQLAAAETEGSLTKWLKKLSRADLLVVDDWGIQKLGDHQTRLFVEILEDRCGSGSTLMTSQYPVASWHQVVGNPVLADAVCDRLVHNAYHIELAGESMRKLRRLDGEGCLSSADHIQGTD